MAQTLVSLLLFCAMSFAQDTNEATPQGEALFSPPGQIIEEVNPEPSITQEVEELPEEFSPITKDDNTKEPLPFLKKQGQKIDSRYFQNKRLIEHPNAARGLIKIDKERVYLYRVPVSEQTRAASLRLGTYNPDNLENPDVANAEFTDLYTNDDFPMFQYDYERIFMQGFGKLAWKLGTGLYYAQGHGTFETSTNAGLTPREQFTLVVFPMSAGLTYRLQFKDTQMLVPFVGGGLDAFCFAERRDDDLNPDIGARLGLAPMAHANGGLSVRLGRGPRAFVDLDREYGINALSLLLEYKQYFALNNRYDFSSAYMSGGFLFDY